MAHHDHTLFPTYATMWRCCPTMGNSELYQLHTVLLAFAKGFCDSFGTEKEKERKADNLPSVHAFKITPSKKMTSVWSHKSSLFMSLLGWLVIVQFKYFSFPTILSRIYIWWIYFIVFLNWGYRKSYRCAKKIIKSSIDPLSWSY